jgi:hypothetical protein
MSAESNRNLKVFVLSNCQAATVGMAWKAMRPEDEVDYAEVHGLLGKLEQQEDVARKIAQSDVLLYAPISDTYEVVFARSSNIKKLKGPQKLMMPAIFFEGLHPDVMYIGDALGRVSSAAGDYNSRIVLQSFLLGLDEDQAINRMTSPDIYRMLGYFDVWKKSLAELERRDLHCDIPVADLMMEGYKNNHQLYTVNHPMNNLIVAMVKRIFEKLSLSYVPVDENFIPATLVLGPIWPIFDFLLKKHSLLLKSVPFFKTAHSQNTNQIFGVREFVIRTYRIYQRNLDKLLNASQVQKELEKLSLNGNLVRSRLLGVEFNNFQASIMDTGVVGRIMADATFDHALFSECTESDINLAYEYLLDRSPESMVVIENNLKFSRLKMIAAITNSQEYVFKRGNRVDSPCNEQSVQKCIRFFLGRNAVGNDFELVINPKKNIADLVDEIVSGKEFASLLSIF